MTLDLRVTYVKELQIAKITQESQIAKITQESPSVADLMIIDND